MIVIMILPDNLMYGNNTEKGKVPKRYRNMTVNITDLAALPVKHTLYVHCSNQLSCHTYTRE